MNEKITEELTTFTRKLKVPAAVGGVLSRDGQFQASVVGTLHRESSTLVATDDQWHIGSCTKSITALLFGKLVEQGKAAWGLPLTDLFPDLAQKIHPNWANRTIDEVFQCRAGIRANPPLRKLKEAYADDRPLTEQRTDAALSTLIIAPKPRGKFVYSNLGYMIIGAAIDRLAAMPFEQALHRYILEPLEVSSVGWGPPPLVSGHRSRFRVGSFSAFPGKPADPMSHTSDNPRMMSSAGTMHISFADWAKIQRVFIDSGTGLVTEATVSHLTAMPTNPKTDMAMGWGRADLAGASIGMQGSNTFWSATALVSENRDRTSLVICNDGRSSVLMQSAVLAGRLFSIV